MRYNKIEKFKEYKSLFKDIKNPSDLITIFKNNNYRNFFIQYNDVMYNICGFICTERLAMIEIEGFANLHFCFNTKSVAIEKIDSLAHGRWERIYGDYMIYTKDDYQEEKAEEPKSQTDIINKAPHYNQSKYEVIDVIHEFDLGFDLGNAFKYIVRAGKKDPTKFLEDLKKAEYYLKSAKKYLSDQPSFNRKLKYSMDKKDVYESYNLPNGLGLIIYTILCINDEFIKSKEAGVILLTSCEVVLKLIIEMHEKGKAENAS